MEWIRGFMESNKVLLRKGIYYNEEFSCIVSSVGNIHLTPNEKKLLDIILDQRGRKDTIIDEIWYQQGMVVSEASYYQLIKMLRRKFAAAGLEASCLKTIPRYGIIFVDDSPDESEKWGEEGCLPEPLSEIRQLPSNTQVKPAHTVLNRLKSVTAFIIRPYRFYLNVLMMLLIAVMVNLLFSCER